MDAPSTQPMDPAGETGKLCTWINSIELSQIPDEIKTRAKYLILDGVACALVGAHFPWSEKAANAIFDMESSGSCNIIGWERVRPPFFLYQFRFNLVQKISPVAAALLNSTFIQGFELDDWHSEAPLHSNAIILPALFAGVSTLLISSPDQKVTGSSLLLAYLVGLEVGPRVGNALYGKNMLTVGWHSGAVFGPSASAAAVSKLLSLPASQIEDALGIACTQACGLMSAQFESEVKRMQHGFAARNGLLGALLARGGYIGIKKVYEREYGGFLEMFGKGSGREPKYLLEEVTKGLGEEWKTRGVRVKPYAAMAATHASVDCVRKLQEQHPEKMGNLKEIESVELRMGEVSFHHGGFKAVRPLTSVGAQMSCSYVAVTQMVDREVLPPQFRYDMLERDEVWELVDKTQCVLVSDKRVEFGTEAVITFEGGEKLTAAVKDPRGVVPALSNEEIVEKWKGLTKGVIDDRRRDEIQKLCLGLDDLDDVSKLEGLLAGLTKNPIA